MCNCPRCTAKRRAQAAAQSAADTAAAEGAARQADCQSACGPCCAVPDRSFWPTFALPRALRGENAQLIP